jgi:MOSC domain-containing protein YiiM
MDREWCANSISMVKCKSILPVTAGEHCAVFVYQMESYHYWERFLGRNGTEFEVTQPGVTCYRVGIRMNEPRMPALLAAHHRP